VSADFDAPLGAGAAIGPHRASSSAFGATGGFDLDELGTMVDKNE
jgi:hypothetical protein